MGAMQIRRSLFLLLALPVLLIAAACGDDDHESPKGGGTDEEYLKTICVGTANFSDALLSKTTADEIAKVVRDFADEMKKANPPADLVEYNEQFVKYLEDAVNDPTSLVTRQPPLPSEDIQQRLANLEPTIPECKDPTFFSRAAKD